MHRKVELVKGDKAIRRAVRTATCGQFQLIGKIRRFRGRFSRYDYCITEGQLPQPIISRELVSGSEESVMITCQFHHGAEIPEGAQSAETGPVFVMVSSL